MSEQSLLGQPEAKPNGAPEGAQPAGAQPAGAPNPNEGKDPPGDKPAGEGAKPEETPKPLELKSPEGVEIEPTSLAEFTKTATELKLSQETAQTLVNWYAKHNAEAAKAQAETWTKTNQDWIKAAKEDKEIGGDKFDGTVTSAKLAIKKFGNEAFTEALNYTGMGNHPEMIRFLGKVAAAFKEDGFVKGGEAPPAEKKSAAEILFPNQGK